MASNLTVLQVKKLAIKPGLVVDVAISTVDCDCDIQICESDFQRTVNQPVMYR